MTVTYELQPSDLRAFAAFARKHAPSIKRIRRVMYVFIAGLSFLTAATNDFDNLLQRAVAFCLVLALMLLLCWIIGWLLVKVGQWRLLTSEQQQGVLCQHSITLGDDALIEITPVNESRYLWRGIHHIAQTPEHIYIFINAQAAHIIPKRAFADADAAREFYERATKLCLDATRAA